jgi:hypothetical protein
MAYSTTPKVRRDGTITLQDGTSPAAVTLDVSYEEGNFSFSEVVDAQTVIRDRGTIVAVRKGDSEPLSGSFSFYFRQFTDGSNAGSVRDFIQGAANYSANISTGTAGTPFVEHFCVNIKYFAEGTDFGDDTDHTVTLSKCVCTLDFSEGDPSQFTLNFTCYGGIVAT